MSQFADKWNDLSDRHDTADELRHYIVTKRKSKKWFRFGDEYDRLHAPRKNELSASEWRAFHKIHLELNVGRDRYGADPELRQKLEDRFFARTGRFVSGERLYGLAMAQQKHRVNGWPNILVSPKRGRGYRDIGEVG